MLYLNNVKSDIAIMLQWLSCPPATTFTSCQYCAVCIQKFIRRTLYPICLLGTNFRTWILHQIISLPSLPYPYNGADATACVWFTSIRHKYVHTNQTIELSTIPDYRLHKWQVRFLCRDSVNFLGTEYLLLKGALQCAYCKTIRSLGTTFPKFTTGIAYYSML